MGELVRGIWRDQRPAGEEARGRFIRGEAHFRSWVTPDGAAGPTGRGGFRAEPGRYHLYVSPACPWSHRAIIYRALKRLDKVVPMTVVDWHMGSEGWTFSTRDGATPDPVYGAKRLSEAPWMPWIALEMSAGVAKSASGCCGAAAMAARCRAAPACASCWSRA